MEKEEFDGSWPPPPDFDDYLQIFNRRDIEGKVDHIENAVMDKESGERIKSFIRTLYKRGEYRRFWRMDLIERRKKLADLRMRFPNFSEVLTDVEGMFALSDLDGSCLRLQPMLIVGAPGVGKSYFCEELAPLLCFQPPTIIQLATAQTNARLSGSDSFWSNSAPGEVLKSLIFGDCAAPVFILEEMDKIGRYLQYDPIGSLYQLFEPSTARSFVDLAYDFLKLDASRIHYLCTANSLDGITDAILSRLRLYEIENLSPAQSRDAVHQIFASVLYDLPVQLRGMSMDHDVVASLISHPPRSIKNTLTRAIGRAVRNGRVNRLMIWDLKGSESSQARKMGF